MNDEMKLEWLNEQKEKTTLGTFYTVIEVQDEDETPIDDFRAVETKILHESFYVMTAADYAKLCECIEGEDEYILTYMEGDDSGTTKCCEVMPVWADDSFVYFHEGELDDDWYAEDCEEEEDED